MTASVVRTATHWTQSSVYYSGDYICYVSNSVGESEPCYIQTEGQETERNLSIQCIMTFFSDILLKKEVSEQELFLIIVVVSTVLGLVVLLALVTCFYFYRKGNKGVLTGRMIKSSRVCHFETNWSQVRGVRLRQTIPSWCPALLWACLAWNSTLRLRLTLYSFSGKQKLKMRNLTFFEMCQVLQIVVFFATGGNSHSQFKYKAILYNKMTDTSKTLMEID